MANGLVSGHNAKFYGCGKMVLCETIKNLPYDINTGDAIRRRYWKHLFIYTFHKFPFIRRKQIRLAFTSGMILCSSHYQIGLDHNRTCVKEA